MQKENLYYLIQFPDWHELIDEPWFDKEALPSNNSSYFFPAKRIYELDRLREIKEGTRKVTTCCGSDNYKIPALICDMEDNIEIQGEPFDVVCNICNNMTTIESIGKFVPYGMNTLNGNHAVFIQFNPSGKTARLKFTDADLPSTWLEIYHEEESVPYVELNNIQYFLNQFVKIKN